MKQVATAVIVADVLMCLLLLFAWSSKSKGGVVNTVGIAERQETKKICLTFDDGPHPYYTEQGP